ncbi:MAG: response regulator [Desulfovibrionaceae bacterium]
MRILLVEDNQLNALATSRILERCGHEVDQAYDGREAVECMRTGEYDLVLMDLMMPVMDGYEATRRIRKLEGQRSRVPIVAVTALMAGQARDHCLQAGMDCFLTKPVTEAEFCRLIRGIQDSDLPHACPEQD